MFGREKPGDGSRYAAPDPVVHTQSPVTPPRPSSVSDSDAVSSIAADVTIVGKLIGKGVVKVFGRIEGELQASNVTICEGAQVEGNLVAQELTIGGLVKGTVHAVRVKLLGTAKVEGDIFHRSLSIEENALFEGTSRREDDPTNRASTAQPRAQPHAVPAAQATPVPQPAPTAHVAQMPLAQRVSSIDAT
jgi:cytoskeletal protein CcmA (bactofilin family)